MYFYNINSKKLTAISLIELIVTLSIVAILIGISYSSASGIKMEYRRKEAQSELVKLKSNIEALAMSGQTSSLAIATRFLTDNKRITTQNGYYAIKVLSADPIPTTRPNPGYTLNAVAQGPQTKDTPCKTMSLQVSAGQDDTKTPSECWK